MSPIHSIDLTLVPLGYATDTLDTAANRIPTQRIHPGSRRSTVAFPRRRLHEFGFWSYFSRLSPIYSLDSAFVWLGYASNTLDTAANRTPTLLIRPGIRRLRVVFHGVGFIGFGFGADCRQLSPIYLLDLAWIQNGYVTDMLDTAANCTLIGLRRCLYWIRINCH